MSLFKADKKISIRELREEDVGESYYYWLNDPEANQFLESRFFPNSLVEIRSYVSSMQGSHVSVLFAIIENETNTHIGNIKLGPINWIHRFADIGLIIDKKSSGKGYATEAISLIVKYAFRDLNLHKVTAGAYKENVASIRAFEKNGFLIEGCKSSQYFYNGEYTDVLMFGLINDYVK